MARVDDDDDAVRWDEELGWLADVTVVGGELDGEGPIPCQVGWAYGKNGAMLSSPIERGAQVVVLVTEGDANALTVIVGVVPVADQMPPTEVNGESIDEALLKATHVFVTPHNVEQQVGSLWRVSSIDDAKLLSQNVKLAEDDASQSYVRGEDQRDALGQFLTSLSTWIELVRLGVVAGGGTLDNTDFTAAIDQLRSGLDSALSLRIKGE